MKIALGLLFSSFAFAQLSGGLPFPGPGMPASSGGGGATLVSHTGQGTAANGGTTTGITTTGATCILAEVVSFGPDTAPTFSDSQGGNSNTYTLDATTLDSGNNIRIEFYHSAPTHVGVSHTFTASGTGVFASIFIQAWSGVSCTKQTVIGAGSSASVISLQPGSVTPSATSVVATGAGASTDLGVGGFSITSTPTFTISDQVELSGGNFEGGAMAYAITSSTVNPTWNFAVGSAAAVNIGVFQ